MLSPGSPANLNILWAGVIIDELCRWGVSDWWVSPGYRDAPIIAALQQRPHLRKHVAIDERSGAFRALACARLLGRPTALLCTSGTAGANYFPALIEASRDQVPLLVLTADRPFAAIRSGANQVIEQSGLFGSNVRGALNLPEPGPALSAAALAAHVGLLAEKALSFPAGPVHLNIPLSEPLEPVIDLSLSPDLIAIASLVQERRALLPASVQRQPAAITPASAAWLRTKIAAAARPLIIVGRLSPARPYPFLQQWLSRSGWPVFFDIGAQFLAQRNDALLSPQLALDSLRRYAPDLILQLGQRTVAKHFNELVTTPGVGPLVVAGSDQDLADPMFVAAQRLICDEEELAVLMLAEALTAPSERSRQLILDAQQERRRLQEALADAAFGFPVLAHTLLPLVPAGSVLILGNSSTVRAFDTWGLQATGAGPRVLLQRGVSGIEGHISAALGAAASQNAPVTVVLGDIAMLHDLNAAMDLAQIRVPLVIVLANNRGGGIFRNMPLGRFPAVHAPLITTPHQWDFAGLAEWLGLAYSLVHEQIGLKQSYQNALAHGGATLIECVIDDASDAQLQARLSRT